MSIEIFKFGAYGSLHHSMEHMLIFVVYKQLSACLHNKSGTA